MESIVRTAKETILHFMEKGISDPTFAPVYLGATIDNCDAQIARVELTRNRESMWSGKAYHDEMKGYVDTYPKLDLTKFPWEFSKSVPFQVVQSGRLRSQMQKQVDCALKALPFQIIPIDDSLGCWRDAFTGKQSFNRFIYFRLFRQDVPEWITGVDKLHMSGSWKVFLSNPSPERELIDRLFTYERRLAELERIRAVRSTSTAPHEEELASLQSQVQEGLEKLAA